MLQFSCRFAFLSTFWLSNRTPKIERILTLYQANTPTVWRGAILKKNIAKLIIFGTHNLQIFKHNTDVNELLLMQFYLFNIRPKLHHWKWWKLRLTLFRTFSPSQAACWSVLCPTLIRKLCYKLPSVITFTFIQTCDQNFELYRFKIGAFFWDTVYNYKYSHFLVP